MSAYNDDPNLAKITRLNHELSEAYDKIDALETNNTRLREIIDKFDEFHHWYNGGTWGHRDPDTYELVDRDVFISR